MDANHCDSSYNDDDEDDDRVAFAMKRKVQNRYSKRKKMNEYLRKWKGYSSTNDNVTLETDLDYDALVLDYTFRKKKKTWKKHSKFHHSTHIDKRIYTTQYDDITDNLMYGGDKLDHRQIKGAKQKAFAKKIKKHSNTPEKDEDDEYSWPETFSSEESDIDDSWVTESTSSTFMPTDFHEHLDEEKEMSDKKNPPT
ncbi:hypothetical protein ACH3XW_43740 [Acanthocheilonema viteae]|uniref:Chromo domain-containing protein n=1 Tax=Acanthocheilonema viteae TaxID=6277 RepID=A0A498SMX2_ACAVI|nr:unnamed protein product [Acanthocheilonema viteae]